MVDNDFRVGILLIDASATTGEAFRTDVWVIRLENASDLATTTCSASEEDPRPRQPASTVNMKQCTDEIQAKGWLSSMM